MYTMERGRVSFSGNERAFIFEDSNLDPGSNRIFATFQRREVNETVFVTYLTALHVLLQVAIGLTIMKLIPTYYGSISKGRGGTQVDVNSSSVSIFWANIFFATILDMLSVVLDLYLIVSVYRGVDDAIAAITSNRRSALQTVFAFGMLGTLVTLCMTILQFIVAAGIPKNTKLYIPGVLKLLFCFFHCHCPCKKADGEFWNKVLQTFAIWFIMVFLQLVAGSVIPYLVLAIVNPVPAVTFLALGASTLFCLIISVASVIQIGARLKKSTCYEKVVALVQGLVFVVFLGLVAITVIIYQGVIQSGTDTGVISGIALSLVPSGVIAVLGFVGKSKLLNDGEENDQNEEHESLLARAASIIRRKLPKEVDPKNQMVEDVNTMNGVKVQNSNGVDDSLGNGKENTVVFFSNLEVVQKTNSDDSDVESVKSCELRSDTQKYAFKNSLFEKEGTDSGSDTVVDNIQNPLDLAGKESDADADGDGDKSKSDLKENDEPQVYNKGTEDVVLKIDGQLCDHDNSALN